MQNVLIIVGAGNPDNSDAAHLEFEGDVMCVGRGIEHYKGDINSFAMWCVDGNMFNQAKDDRKEAGLNSDFKCFSFLITSSFAHLPLPVYGAGSAMYGIQLGIHLGYDKIILVDCPLDDYCAAYQEGFNEAFPLIKDKVRSMSGFTKELFGEPTDDWINT